MAEEEFGTPFTVNELVDKIRELQATVDKLDSRVQRLERESDEGRRATMVMRWRAIHRHTRVEGRKQYAPPPTPDIP